MTCLCSFDPERDIQAVDQTGFVDLAAAHLSGSVPASISSSPLSFNEVEDPNSISDRPRDQFEAMQANKSILSREELRKFRESSSGDSE